MRVILLFHKWMDGWSETCVGGIHVKALQRPIKILFWRHPVEEIACGMRPWQIATAWLLMF